MKPTLINRLTEVRPNASALLSEYESGIKAMKPTSLRIRQVHRKNVVRDLLRLTEDMRREIERLEAKLEAK